MSDLKPKKLDIEKLYLPDFSTKQDLVDIAIAINGKLTDAVLLLERLSRLSNLKSEDAQMVNNFLNDFRE